MSRGSRLVLFVVSIAVLLIIGYPFYRDLLVMSAKKRAQEQFNRRVKQLNPSLDNEPLSARGRISGTARKAIRNLSMETDNVPAAAPSFELQALREDTHTLDRHRDQWLFINFWATWCRACRQEMPSMQRLWEKYGDRPDFTMLAINVQEQKPAIRRFVDQHDLTFPVLLDSDGDVADRFNVTGIPETVIVTPDGHTIGKAIGYRLWDSEDSLTLWTELLKLNVSTE